MLHPEMFIESPYEDLDLIEPEAGDFDEIEDLEDEDDFDFPFPC